MIQLNLLSLTSKEFSDQVFGIFQKGRDHALKYYKSFFKTGDGMNAYNPSEPQSESLLKAIHNLCTMTSWKIDKSLVNQLTEKYAIKFNDNLVAELVVIPMKTGLTLCVSSQVGCRMGCRFCETGKMGKLRDLHAHEIVAQLFFAKQTLKKNITNIVFMGMGEPFDNYENVTKAIDIMTDIYGLKMPFSSITVSTSGIVPKILDFIEYGQKGVKLAVSINGSNSNNRSAVMPINRKYPLDILKKALKEFAAKTTSTILAEYVMMSQINDDIACADELADYLNDVPCLINLIPYNPQSQDQFAPPEEIQIKAFQKKLLMHGFKVFVRQTKGDQIMAACGQLGQINLKKSLSQKQDTL